MTSRVFNCHTTRPLRDAAADDRSSSTRAPFRGVKLAAGLALLLVPIAGAAERPYGWPVAGLVALALLVLASIIGRHVSWGWLLVLVATAGVVTPRGDLAVIGPALFVATAICLLLWLANVRSGGGKHGDGRPRPGSREREAQVLMGMYGERHVGEILARELPQEYVLINGLKLPRGAGDIDHLVVGPTGVFLLETKTMAGRIVCELDGSWRRTRIGRGGTPYAAYIGDPAAQVQRNIFAVRESLRTRLPGLFQRSPLWIEGLVVFAHPRTELQAEHSRVPAVRLEEAAPRISLHVPQRWLRDAEVDQVVEALLADAREGSVGAGLAAQSAQAVVEVALLLPVVLALLFGTIGLSRVIQAQTAVVAVAHEAARAGALGKSPADAVERMHQRVQLVAPGVGLDAGRIELAPEVSMFRRDRARVIAVVRYPLDFRDLPLAGWIPPSAVRAEHAEWIDPFRSGIGLGVDDSP